MDYVKTINSREELASKKNEFAGILSRAFYNDPFYVWIMPNDKKRLNHIHWWMTILLRYTFLYGNIDYSGDHKGVAMWIGPDNPFPKDIKIFSMGMILYPFKIGIRNFLRALDLSGQWSRGHKKMPARHYYLVVMGVEPEFQGKGIGSDLMQYALKKIDNEKLECYLETVTPEDVKFYEKHNFKVFFNKGFGIDNHYWLMKRKSRIDI